MGHIDIHITTQYNGGLVHTVHVNHDLMVYMNSMYKATIVAKREQYWGQTKSNTVTMVMTLYQKTIVNNDHKKLKFR